MKQSPYNTAQNNPGALFSIAQVGFFDTSHDFLLKGFLGWHLNTSSGMAVLAMNLRQTQLRGTRDFDNNQVLSTIVKEMV